VSLIISTVLRRPRLAHSLHLMKAILFRRRA
jgi:hypothetical protein